MPALGVDPLVNLRPGQTQAKVAKALDTVTAFAHSSNVGCTSQKLYFPIGDPAGACRHGIQKQGVTMGVGAATALLQIGVSDSRI